jgi:hypothetical protein
MQSDASDWCRLKSELKGEGKRLAAEIAARADPIITDAHSSGFLLCLYCFTAVSLLGEMVSHFSVIFALNPTGNIV